MLITLNHRSPHSAHRKIHLLWFTLGWECLRLLQQNEFDNSVIGAESAAGDSSFDWIWFLTKMASSIKLVLLASKVAVPTPVFVSGNAYLAVGPLAGTKRPTSHILLFKWRVINGKVSPCIHTVVHVPASLRPFLCLLSPGEAKSRVVQLFNFFV